MGVLFRAIYLSARPPACCIECGPIRLALLRLALLDWRSPVLFSAAEITQVDSVWHVKVSDFGLSRQVDSSKAASTVLVTNPRCAPQGQLEGRGWLQLEPGGVAAATRARVGCCSASPLNRMWHLHIASLPAT